MTDNFQLMDGTVSIFYAVNWHVRTVCITNVIFLKGCGVNLGMRGLESLGLFIYRTATAQDQNDVFEALSAKIQHSKHVAESFRQTGLAATMFEWMDVRELDAGETMLSLKAYKCHG